MHPSSDLSPSLPLLLPLSPPIWRPSSAPDLMPPSVRHSSPLLAILADWFGGGSGILELVAPKNQGGLISIGNAGFVVYPCKIHRVHMTRSKLHVVECNDEYMTEEHIEHENTMCKDVESSHVQPSSCNVEEGLNDSDDEEYQDDIVANEQGNYLLKLR
ncbi:hypothetical protein ZWY2020_022028 [Hordeum vulgare]|nr:hypothetical protein ZWY2020_022028 [Hordeum vulgare]